MVGELSAYSGRTDFKIKVFPIRKVCFREKAEAIGQRSVANTIKRSKHSLRENVFEINSVVHTSLNYLSGSQK